VLSYTVCGRRWMEEPPRSGSLVRWPTNGRRRTGCTLRRFRRLWSDGRNTSTPSTRTRRPSLSRTTSISSGRRRFSLFRMCRKNSDSFLKNCKYGKHSSTVRQKGAAVGEKVPNVFVAVCDNVDVLVPQLNDLQNVCKWLAKCMQMTCNSHANDLQITC